MAFAEQFVVGQLVWSLQSSPLNLHRKCICFSPNSSQNLLLLSTLTC